MRSYDLITIEMPTDCRFSITLAHSYDVIFDAARFRNWIPESGVNSLFENFGKLHPFFLLRRQRQFNTAYAPAK